MCCGICLPQSIGEYSIVGLIWPCTRNFTIASPTLSPGKSKILPRKGLYFTKNQSGWNAWSRRGWCWSAGWGRNSQTSCRGSISYMMNGPSHGYKGINLQLWIIEVKITGFCIYFYQHNIKCTFPEKQCHYDDCHLHASLAIHLVWVSSDPNISFWVVD